MIAAWVLPLIIVIAIWVLIPIVRGKQEQIDEQSDTQAAVDMMMQDVRDAQLDHDLGRLSDDDYSSLTQEKEQQLDKLL